MPEENPQLEFFGQLLMEHVRDQAIRDSARLLDRRTNSTIAAQVTEIISSFDDEDVSVVKRLIPIIVDATLHHLLWTLEQWPNVRVAIATDSGSIDDIRTATLGELQGYLYDWIPRFSEEPYDPLP
ncbi:MAG TPA: hypothetical protein VH393_10635 [Ktedonobacterales bacterium]|jgi:hypothetical protein